MSDKHGSKVLEGNELGIALSTSQSYAKLISLDHFAPMLVTEHVSRLFHGRLCFCCSDLVHDCGRQVRQDISMCTSIKQARWTKSVFVIVIIDVYYSTILQLDYVSSTEDGSRNAFDASNAAHNMLMALSTHRSHGMVPTPTLEDRRDHEAEPEGEEDYPKSSTCAGQLLPANHQLQTPCCLKQSLQSSCPFSTFQAITVIVASSEVVVLLTFQPKRSQANFFP